MRYAVTGSRLKNGEQGNKAIYGWTLNTLSVFLPEGSELR